MTKYSEQDIIQAYLEFESDKEWVGRDAHEIVAYDFLSMNMPITDYLRQRKIFPLYLYCCLDRISHAETLSERFALVDEYCKKNGIAFSQYPSLEIVYRFGMDPIAAAMSNNKNITVLFDPKKCDVVAHQLASLLRRSIASNASFGIMEYYAYFDLDIRELQAYLDSAVESKPELYIAKLFVEVLDMKHDLDEVDFHEAFKANSRVKKINNLYVNNETFRKNVSSLLTCRYPVLTGTLNYVYGLSEQKTIEKQKIKSLFEERSK